MFTKQPTISFIVTRMVALIFSIIFTWILLPSTFAQESDKEILIDTPSSYLQKIKKHAQGENNEVFKINTKNTRDLVKSYCSTILDKDWGKQQFFNNVDAAQMMYFDANQSVFAYILCSPWGYAESFPQITDSEILKKEKRSAYWIDCSTDSDLDGCDFHRSVHNIMIELLNDLSNIKIWSAYWVSDYDEKTTLTKMGNDFGRYFFGDNIILCDPEHKVDNTCTYPKTLNHLKSYLRRGDTISKKNTVFDLEKLSPLEETICLKGITATSYSKYNNYSCGLLGTLREKGEWREPASLHDFTNLVYNEIWRYKLFTTYYAHELRNNLEIQPYALTASPNFFIEEANNDADNMLLTSRIVEKTAEDMILQISHIQFKFPIHIWLMMYYERLWDLRKSLVRIYTPLHQLYYKLRNVQQAK